MVQLGSILAAVILFTVATAAKSKESEIEYGVDVSYPMHTGNVSINYPWLAWNKDSSIPVPDEYSGMPLQPLSNRQEFYDDMIHGCVQHYNKKKKNGGRRCLNNEVDRIKMGLRQPAGLYNYTELGFTKIRAPENVFRLIKNFWEQNKHEQNEEMWPAGNTYVNHWDSPSYMVSIEDDSKTGGGPELKQHIWNAARDTISEWTGQQLAECSLYGIRIYKEGAVLATHVDRLPLVSSAIINVDQDVDEPWPLEVIGHDGKAHNVTMEPGDLVLYESHTILHGRPFALKGRFMANIFLHFEPIGPVGEEIVINPDLPQYVVPGSDQEQVWRRENRNGYELHNSGFTTGSTPIHQAAGNGNAKEVKRLLKTDGGESVNMRDSNGWAPLHEAARNGNVEVVEVLIEHGADVNMRTQLARGRPATGGSVLWWAEHFLGDEHEIVRILRKNGAKLLGPGDKTEL